METNKNTESGSDESPENIFALSLPKGEESFPVLKAFQEFLDAERERARRRQMILTLSFMSAIVVLVVLFSVLGAILFNGMARRNDIKQDKLFEILLTERQASTSVPVPASTLLRQDPVVDEVMELVKQLRAETEALKAAVQRPVEPQPACEGEAVPNLASAASISVAVEEKPEPLPKRTGVFSSPKRKPEQTTSHAEADVAPSGPVSENKEVIERAEPEKKTEPADTEKNEDGLVQVKVVPSRVMHPPAGYDAGEIAVVTEENVRYPWRVLVPAVKPDQVETE